MKIIPVIDLKNGVVVSAQYGQRESYLPIKSKLISSSSIEDILNGFLSVYPFKTFYIADLNAITKTGSNYTLIERVASKNPDIEFWIDNGVKINDLSNTRKKNIRLIIGSESQDSVIFNNHLKNNILSLDFFPNQGYTGPAELIANSDLWPEDVIIMTLDRVGGNAGPSFERLKRFCQKYPDKHFIAAGGIRDEIDLLNLQKIGVNHALIASALHSGVINYEVIIKLQAKKCPG